ncbi:hypothetical protein GCM10023238_36660 [Streptomyces heliomycini]
MGVAQPLSALTTVRSWSQAVPAPRGPPPGGDQADRPSGQRVAGEVSRAFFSSALKEPW